MKSLLLTAFVTVCLTMPSLAVAKAADNGDKSLQGVWIAESMEIDGKPAPKKAVEQMRFNFKGKKLLVRGNHGDDREEECDYRVDATKSPKHLDFTPPKEKNPVLGIYEVNGDELKICLRHASSSDGRPTKFATKADSKLVLVLLTKQAQVSQ